MAKPITWNPAPLEGDWPYRKVSKYMYVNEDPRGGEPSFLTAWKITGMVADVHGNGGYIAVTCPRCQKSFHFRPRITMLDLKPCMVCRRIMVRTWENMCLRCFDSKDMNFRDYGYRGITVCERWFEFSNFAIDMGPRPAIGLSIDRIDVNGDYEPSNCRWATPGRLPESAAHPAAQLTTASRGRKWRQ